MEFELDLLNKFIEILNRSFDFIIYYHKYTKLIDLINKCESIDQTLIDDLINTFKLNCNSSIDLSKNTQIKTFSCYDCELLNKTKK
ncbi:hypothetical protein A0H76_1640 [Hepatospora eriocheir]|uniref:Uncharacterized protein n=1 Tax=Hepatospora eriocheir TaxID=1081669 RepID=A0A1X0Q5S6_9MICR|nr:hypothetical protein A0H76_1640 [Hepatospora eriocheir]